MARRRNNVVSMRGAPLPIPKRNPDVLAKLSEFTSLAHGGGITAMAYATISPEGHYATGWVGLSDKHVMVAAVAMLAHRICHAAED